MPLLIERELAALAPHQNIAELRGADRRRGTPSFADVFILIHRPAVPQNRSERKQPRIAIKDDAPVDLRDTFQHGRRKLESVRLSQEIMEPILGACSLPPFDFKEIGG